MRKTPVESLCKPLPHEITKHAATTEDRERIVLNFLETSLPNSDVNEITAELKKTFIFGKLKSHDGGKKVLPKKGKYLSSRKRKLLGLKNISSETGLKELACSTVDSRWEITNQKLMRADLHGARVTVVRSKCPSLVGINGIVLQDTRNTFRVMGRDDKIKTIPKEVVVIKIHLPGAALELFAKELCIRPAERAVKKFKANHLGEL
ncbi:ribonuclease P protein subunit p29 isoform X3 [Diachasma alloeum]|uniref:ribonuclease P protein subunit p29 isoform X3 n=1 Tax=Diachasma alloeum TaxID=454923 RepID=UPI00073824E0|nr:ribonuclease P protein subunit p29 isoform X3 [Diachasma alloeum]